MLRISLTLYFIWLITFSVDYQQLLERHLEHERGELQKQVEEDEALVK